MIYAIVILSILFILSAIANYNNSDEIDDLKGQLLLSHEEKEKLHNKLKEKENLLKKLRDNLTVSS